jgi:LysM repeat protein
LKHKNYSKLIFIAIYVFTIISIIGLKYTPKQKFTMYYKIKNNETVEQVAERFKVSTSSIEKQNNVGNWVVPGTILEFQVN